ncbi:MAG: lipoprotein insertase outer membrane protein LolB [Gammaproteobacteria bacterium]|nr:lipoprotein insertase outer membrane protein LolB [Gammaproteobacteria bacterium]
MAPFTTTVLHFLWVKRLLGRNRTLKIYVLSHITPNNLNYSAGVITICLALMITGCTTQQQVPDDIKAAKWQLHMEQVYQLNAWQLKGRIAVQMHKDGWSASLLWQQDSQGYFLRLIAPLGRGVYELTGSENKVELQMQEGNTLTAKDPEALLKESLGWHFPLSGLSYWVRGVPQPGVKLESFVLDRNGRIADMSQSGWQISYLQYSNITDYHLPKKIVMHNEKLKIRLIIKDWQI